MSWKQVLEVKPEVETAVDVATSGDPCCETARDKFMETMKNFEATSPNHIPMPPEVKHFIRGAPCEDLAELMDLFIRSDNHRPLTLEVIEIRNEWIECDNTGKPLHAIPVK